MNAASLIDLSPLWQVLLVGALLAAVALAWVWWRQRTQVKADWACTLTVLTLFLTFDLVLFGSFTRLSDSGLGCPDWPGCYGSASPVGAQAEITAAQTLLPTGPVTHGKAWVEMVHRYMATGVGGLILVLALASWFRRWRGTLAEGELGVWWPTFTLLWVCVQGAFGALTVTMKLFPAIVTLHLLGGLMLLVLLSVQAERLVRLRAGGLPVTLDAVTRTTLKAACLLLGLQLALGGWVSTNYAVLACSDFPKCQNSWWPDMHFSQGFQIWRELGMTPDGDYISFAALTAIHFVHRAMAAVVLVALGVLAWRLSKVAGLRRLSRWIIALSLLQLASGLGNVVLGWPLAAALMHSGGAAALVIVLAWAVAASRVQSPATVAAAASAVTAAPRLQRPLAGPATHARKGYR